MNRKWNRETEKVKEMIIKQEKEYNNDKGEVMLKAIHSVRFIFHQTTKEKE